MNDQQHHHAFNNIYKRVYYKQFYIYYKFEFYKIFHLFPNILTLNINIQYFINI